MGLGRICCGEEKLLVFFSSGVRLKKSSRGTIDLLSKTSFFFDFRFCSACCFGSSLSSAIFTLSLAGSVKRVGRLAEKYQCDCVINPVLRHVWSLKQNVSDHNFPTAR